MKTSLEMVREFHAAFAPEQTHDKPHVGNEELNKLRLRLLSEELTELVSALATRAKADTLDALCDLQYVLDGAFLALGFGAVKNAAMAEVHRSNMSKVWTQEEMRKVSCGEIQALEAREILPGEWVVRDKGGKVLKSPSYSPANLAQFIE